MVRRSRTVRRGGCGMRIAASDPVPGLGHAFDSPPSTKPFITHVDTQVADRPLPRSGIGARGPTAWRLPWWDCQWAVTEGWHRSRSACQEGQAFVVGEVFEVLDVEGGERE